MVRVKTPTGTGRKFKSMSDVLKIPRKRPVTFWRSCRSLRHFLYPLSWISIDRIVSTNKLEMPPASAEPLLDQTDLIVNNVTLEGGAGRRWLNNIPQPLSSKRCLEDAFFECS